MAWVMCLLLGIALAWLLIASFSMHLEHRKIESDLRERLLAWEMFREKFEAMPEPEFENLAKTSYTRFGWRLFEARVIDILPPDQPTP